MKRPAADIDVTFPSPVSAGVGGRMYVEQEDCQAQVAHLVQEAHLRFVPVRQRHPLLLASGISQHRFLKGLLTTEPNRRSAGSHP